MRANTALLLAAGRGSRLAPLTRQHPKALTRVGPTTILDHAVAALAKAGLTDIVAATGYLSEQLVGRGLRTVHNARHASDNILGTFHAAASVWERGAVCLYGDIVFDFRIVTALAGAAADIAVVVDPRWRTHYEGRTSHPESEAELVVTRPDGSVARMGKGEDPAAAYGEFIGLWRISPSAGPGIRRRLDALVSDGGDGPEWRRSYLTRFLTLLASEGWRIQVVECRHWWQEIDTLEDLARARAQLTLTPDAPCGTR